jgi:hypothetical protein
MIVLGCVCTSTVVRAKPSCCLHSLIECCKRALVTEHGL